LVQEILRNTYLKQISPAEDSEDLRILRQAKGTKHSRRDQNSSRNITKEGRRQQ